MERPIIFNAEMICAILNGRKTQTRRVVKPQPRAGYPLPECKDELWSWHKLPVSQLIRPIYSSWPYHSNGIKCPYGKPGDQLWVRETHWIDWYPDGVIDAQGRRGAVHYKAKHPYPFIAESIEGWRSSIFMPRWASRLLLRIRDVGTERVQDIAVENAVAEGWPERDVDIPFDSPLGWFQQLWDNINETRGYGWSANPWVWVIEFELLRD
jgi:hypothetical protein